MRFTRRHAAIVAAATVLAGGYAVARHHPAPPPVASACHYHGAFPDPACTPGAVNPNVTQANIQSTICVSGYTSTIRPPMSYTNPLKVRQMAAYGVGGQDPKGFEEDHFIALEIGGNPTDPKNLWPEPYTVPGAHEKDKTENLLRARVCSGQITLAEAQHEITTNWTLVR